MKVRIHISLKQGVLDPQGKAIENALHHLDFKNIQNVRQNKVIELELNSVSSKEDAEQQIYKMCTKLLSNPVMEDYRIEWV